MYLKIHGHPQPKERPRSKGGQRGIYQPISDWERQVTATALKDGGTFTGEVSVSIHFFTRGVRGDIDNLTKAVLDGLNESRCWQDDKKVVCLAAYIHKADTKDDEQALITVTAV